MSTRLKFGALNRTSGRDLNSAHDITRSISTLAGLPASELVLHRGTMLLLDRLVEVGPEHAVCEWRVPEDCLFREASLGVPIHVSIECMAQCVAVHAGARARIEGFGPPLGLLLGTRLFTSAVSHLDEGVKYRVACQELVRDGQGMASYECTIARQARVVAGCRLAVYEKDRGIELNV